MQAMMTTQTETIPLAVFAAENELRMVLERLPIGKRLVGVADLTWEYQAECGTYREVL